jgi:zinc protease
MRPFRRLASVALLLSVCLSACSAPQTPAPASSAAPAAPAITGSADGQTWAQETLANGLRVIYAPMPTTPVTQVRVLYHVGSRDERTDRQGFAHMFEHMMFRGSAHVKPEEHMKLVGLVGGYSNAFTSFDETVYHDTLPAGYTEMALWLEADRMSSFKVSPDIFYTERNVVSEEWRLRLNRSYGGLFELLMPEVFKVHPYRWTPIGNMADLQAAKTADLQAFFEKYYVPNNAVLVVAGNIDLARTQAQVHQYFGWIPGYGPETAAGGAARWLPLERNISPEPAQTAPRRLEVKMPAPLARVMLTFRAPPAVSDDTEALGLLLGVLGDGQSSRIYRRLVTSDAPLTVDAGAFLEDLEDGGVLGVSATVLKGQDPAEVEKVLGEEIAALRDQPVTSAELEKVKQQNRLALATRFETADDVAGVLGQELLIRNHLDRIATARARLEALTPADLQRVAQKYLPDSGVNVMLVTPLTPGTPQDPLPGAPSPTPPASEPATTVVNARAVNFPPAYPTAPPMAGTLPAATFEKGAELALGAAGAAQPPRVVVLEDHRMPIIHWTLALRAGGHAVAPGQEGLAGLTADMVRRGPRGKTFDQFNEDLESRAIDLDVSDGGDVTRITGRCLKEQFPYAMNALRNMLLTPAFDHAEFANLQNQSVSSLRLALNDPSTLAVREVAHDLYGDSPLGRLTTIESLSALSLDHVKQLYATLYKGDGAIMLLSGDISVMEGQAAAASLLAGLPSGKLPAVDYTLPKPPESQRLILIAKPDARQAAIRLGVPAYTLHSDDKFVGTLANQILSAGIESRLGRYVRAEKGYVYDVSGTFSPGRHGGAFIGDTDTRFETTADTITAMFKVFDDMKAADVPDKELADAKFRVSGNLLMSMQTTTEQADRRLEGMINGYPADYYDKYAQRIGQVSAGQLRQVMNQYVLENHMIVVVVGPPTLKPQLDKLGPVQVLGTGPE